MNHRNTIILISIVLVTTSFVPSVVEGTGKTLTSDSMKKSDVAGTQSTNYSDTAISSLFISELNNRTFTTKKSLISSKDNDIVNLISVPYQFEYPIIHNLGIGTTPYSRISIPHTISKGSPGEPLLPSFGARILLPFGETVDTITVTTNQKQCYHLDYKIIPAGEPVPLSLNTVLPPPETNDLIYGSSNSLPGIFFTEEGIHVFRGYRLLSLSLYPVQYVPSEDIVYYYSSITVNITTRETQDVYPSYRGLVQDKQEVQLKVDNPGIIDSYLIENPPPIPEEEYTLLIITTEELKDGFEPLQTVHDAEGLHTMIAALGTDIPVSDDYNQTCLNIRDFIREMYSDSGIEYVLIGGDIDVVPAKYLFFGNCTNEWGDSVTIHGPSDLFYACLDGPYNSDGDRYWGEPDDGENGGDVDLIAEVYVGRACVGNLTEVGYFVNKTLAYMNTTDDYLQDMLMVGEDLYPYDGWGGDYLDELIPLIPSNDEKTGYNISTLYDRDWKENGWDEPDHGMGGWPIEEIIGRINNGTHIINHLGHSGPGSNMKLRLEDGDLEQLCNEKYCFIYSQGCYAGAFDRNSSFGPSHVEDCIAEHFTIKSEYSAFAGVWNARYGWLGQSQRYHEKFIDATCNRNILVISKANQYSKEYLIDSINDHLMRFCYYGLNYFGDPTIRFKHPWLQPHDIGVRALDIGSDHITINAQVTVHATIINTGYNHANNIIASLLINNVEVDTMIIPFLESQAIQNISFLWTTPASAGLYIITVNVTMVGVAEETYTDNEKHCFLRVGIWNVDTDNLFNTIQAAIDDAGTIAGNTIVIPNGIYTENVTVNKSVIITGENRQSTIIQGIGVNPTVLSISETDSVHITNLTVTNGHTGISITSSSQTTITNCEIHNNSCGITVSGDSHHNLIYHNNFNDTQTNAYDQGSNNQWDNGYPCGGNYWHDYIGTDQNNGPNQDEHWPDGIGDTPYNISGSEKQDRYPLVFPYEQHPDSPIINLDTHERFHAIQDAINDENTQPGHTLFVSSGMYNETVLINKTINLIGMHKNTTILENVEETDTIVHIEANGVTISGFTLQGNPEYEPYLLINVESHSAAIQGNILKNAGLGIRVVSVSNTTISNNYFVQTSRGGILASYTPNTTIANNVFDSCGIITNFYEPSQWNSLSIENNKANGRYIRFYKNTKDLAVPKDTSQVILYNCTNITMNNLNLSTVNQGVELQESNYISILNCTISHNDQGIELSLSANNTINNNTLTDNKYFGIIFYWSCSDNMICSNTIGNTIGYGFVNGIEIDFSSSRNTITKNEIKNNFEGIKINFYSRLNNITENIITGNHYNGITIDSSSNNTIINNIISMNLYLESEGNGIKLHCAGNNIISKNIIDRNKNGIFIDFFSYNNTISKNNIFNNTNYGVYLHGGSPNNIILENEIIGNVGGMKLEFVDNEDICMNQIVNNTNIGIEIVESNENNISNNTIRANFDGISINTSYFNDIQKNIIIKNFHGIYFNEGSSSNRIKENNIIRNHNGIYIPGFSYSSNNYISNNNFINNSVQAFDDCVNIWDFGYPDGGNYWSNYAGRDMYGGGNQNEYWPDGIGDTPYLIPGASNKTDRYPLMDPDGWKFVLDQYHSFFTLTNDNMLGLTTCPAGDGPAYHYLKATILNVQGTPLVGIPASSFIWRVISTEESTQYYGDLSCIFNPIDNETNSEGEIRFEIIGNTSIVGQIMIDLHVLCVNIYGVKFLDCKSFDLNVDGSVNLTDFTIFANDYGGTEWRSDFNWDGDVDLADFGMFANHYNHIHP